MRISPIGAIGAAHGFWRTIRTVSAQDIADEADRSFKLAIVGLATDRERLIETLLGDAPSAQVREKAADSIREFDTAPDADMVQAFAYTIYAPDAESKTIGVRGGNSVPLSGELPALAETILERSGTIRLAMGRRFPYFRPIVAQLLIRDMAKTNASFALLSALPAILPPIAGIFLPVSGIADSIIITKNQILLVMRLAALHGRPPGYKKQAKEIIGTVGAAIGWRTVARELVGAVPIVGPAIKAAIAYSGTIAVGQSALYFYQTGTFATGAQIRAIYNASRDEAKKTVERLRPRKAAK